MREIRYPYISCKERIVEEELCKGGFLVSYWLERTLEVEELVIDLKALDPAREVDPRILLITN